MLNFLFLAIFLEIVIEIILIAFANSDLPPQSWTSDFSQPSRYGLLHMCVDPQSIIGFIAIGRVCRCARCL